MKRAFDWLMVCIAVVAVVMLGAGSAPTDVAGTGGTASGGSRHYHPGKNPRVVKPESGCLGAGCHDASPHKRGTGLAPFRNMHGSYVDCPVCHAPDGMTRLKGLHAESGRRHLKYTGTAPSAGTKGHPSLGEPAGCRRCHSEAGAGAIKARGLPSLPSNFSDPIALRMHEGGARRWNP